MNDPFKTHGVFSWNELLTTDVQEAKRFYSSLFGWEFKDMDMGDMTYSVVRKGDSELAGIMPIPDQAAGAPPHWGAFVTVDDVDTVAKKVEALGGKILVPPQDVPTVGRFFLFQDPQGATLSAICYAKIEERKDD